MVETIKVGKATPRPLRFARRAHLDTVETTQTGPSEDRPSRRRKGVRVGAVLAVGFAAAFVAWLVLERTDDETSSVAGNDRSRIDGNDAGRSRGTACDRVGRRAAKGRCFERAAAHRFIWRHRPDPAEIRRTPTVPASKGEKNTVRGWRASVWLKDGLFITRDEGRPLHPRCSRMRSSATLQRRSYRNCPALIAAYARDAGVARWRPSEGGVRAAGPCDGGFHAGHVHGCAARHAGNGRRDGRRAGFRARVRSRLEAAPMTSARHASLGTRKPRKRGAFLRAAGLGLEPRLPDSESGVLPLDDPATALRAPV